MSSWAVILVALLRSPSQLAPPSLVVPRLCLENPSGLHLGSYSTMEGHLPSFSCYSSSSPSTSRAPSHPLQMCCLLRRDMSHSSRRGVCCQDYVLFSCNFIPVCLFLVLQISLFLIAFNLVSLVTDYVQLSIIKFPFVFILPVSFGSFLSRHISLCRLLCILSVFSLRYSES